jgi:predicted RNA-binding protein Jag
MKSIVEEASSVVKAIEKGWALAGKPNEFSVKVFEVEQKNFLGMTTKSAKIALFYTEKVEKQNGPKFSGNEQRHHAKKDVRQPVKKEQTPRNETAQQRPLQKQEAPKKEQVQKEAWTPEMILFCEQWLKQTLANMNMADQTFSLDAKNYYLKINFDKSLLADTEKEKLLFRSFAHLIMQSLRNKFKKGFRGFKIILNS